MSTTPIPHEMTSRRQWITWRDDNGSKIPNGRPNTPSDWKTFDEVSVFDKIAFVFSADDPLTGIDLDGCIVDGQYTDWVLPILERFQGVAYGEISPSGKGLKLTTHARKPQGSRCQHKIGDGKQQIECYDHARFWAVTQNVVEGFQVIGDGQDAVDWLCTTYLSNNPKHESPRRDAPRYTSSQRLIERAKAYAAKATPATNGNRNLSAFSLAGHLFALDEGGYRLAESEVLEIVRGWNDRNAEPLNDNELRRTVRSAFTNGTPRTAKTSSYESSASPPWEGQQPSSDANKTFQGIRPVSIGDLIDAHPELRPVVIDGILRRGETANIIAAAKVGKSFLAGGLAWCIATGTPWLSHDVTQGRVLIIDNELHSETLASRLYRIATESMISVDDYRDSIDVISLRGQNIDIHAIQSRLADIAAGTYTLAIVDALYRTLPSGTSENDNAAMMAIYNRLDWYASQWDCAVAVVHHASKGQQGDKAVTDVGSGAGSISRAADTHIVIRPHENAELSVLECVTRSFKSPEPVSVRFEWPLWSAVATAPEVKKVTRQNQQAQGEADAKAMEQMLVQIPLPPKAIRQNSLFERFGFGENKSRRLVGRLVADGKVEIKRRRKKGGSRASVYYTRKSSSECSSECNSESI